MRHFREWSVAFALGALLVVLAVLAPAFFHRAQLLSILSAAVPVLVVACGAALVISSRCAAFFSDFSSERIGRCRSQRRCRSWPARVSARSTAHWLPGFGSPRLWLRSRLW